MLLCLFCKVFNTFVAHLYAGLAHVLLGSMNITPTAVEEDFFTPVSMLVWLMKAVASMFHVRTPATPPTTTCATPTIAPHSLHPLVDATRREGKSERANAEVWQWSRCLTARTETGQRGVCATRPLVGSAHTA